MSFNSGERLILLYMIVPDMPGRSTSKTTQSGFVLFMKLIA
jgi:hypothetical protein